MSDRDGSLDYDKENHALIFTERLGPDEMGAAAIVGHGVPPWIGHRLRLEESDSAHHVVVTSSKGKYRLYVDGLPPADPSLMSPAEPWYDRAFMWLVIGALGGLMLGAVLMAGVQR